MSDDLDLFRHSEAAVERVRQALPLAARMRPQTIEEFVGQSHLVDGPLGAIIRSGRLLSMVLFGPPGTGKTTLAGIYARATSAIPVWLSGVSDGVARIREVRHAAEERLRAEGTRTIAIIDEIHALTKPQIDRLLPATEDGTLIVVGITTENPTFTVNRALLSRSRVFTFNRLTDDEVGLAVRRCLLRMRPLELETGVIDVIVGQAGGDVRRALGALEAIEAAADPGKPKAKVTVASARELLGATLVYDRTEDRFANLSWYQKSIRNCQRDAAMLALARMLEGGEDPRVIARRLLVIASEDIASPNAMLIADSAARAADQVGMPEVAIPLAKATAVLAEMSPGNDAYRALRRAQSVVRENPSMQPPASMRNASTDGIGQGFGEGYVSIHDDPEGARQVEYLPEGLEDLRLFPDGE